MNNTTTSREPTEENNLNVYYVIFEILVALFAVVGNALVILVFRKERRLRRRTNYYIVSLAAADLLVGLLGIPFAIMSSVGHPHELHACLFTVSLLLVLCTISIFCLVAVSVDRYWAILHPMGYSRNVRTKTAIVIISICWVTGSIVGFLPLLGWRNTRPFDSKCYFLTVMDYDYLVFLYFGTIIIPALVLLAFYAHIYRVVLKQLRQIVTMNPESSNSSGRSSGGTMLRMLGAAQKREVKSTQNLAIIVLFFMICWIPLYTINCYLAFCSYNDTQCAINESFMKFCIILSHLNSAGNPILYAYHLRDFRSALKNFICNVFNHDHQGENNFNRTSLASQSNFRFSTRNNSRFGYNSSRKFSNSQICYRKTSIDNSLLPRVSTIVKNSANLAVATTGETRQIWNIPEGSSESSDSHIPRSQQDKLTIVRPATPYRPRKTSDVSQVNEGYVESSSIEEENDDVFIDDTLPLSEVKCDQMETSLTERLKVRVTPSSPQSRAISTSSPQLSKSLFFVEDGLSNGTKPRSCSCAERSASVDNKVSPFKVVTMFKTKTTLARSLSDDGTTSSESIARKNGTVIRSSCGS